jgi:hypothetical protein
MVPSTGDGEHYHPMGICDDCLQCEVEAARQFRDETIEHIMPPATTPIRLTWESQEWQEYMTNIKMQVGDVAIRAWRNLIEHDYNHDRPRDSPQFKQLIINLMYLMQDDYIAPVRPRMFTGSLPDDTVPTVVLIPRIDIMQLLPPEATLGDFDIPSYFKNIIRSMATTFRNIKQTFSRLISQGRAFDIQMRWSDLYGIGYRGHGEPPQEIKKQD